MYNCYIENRSVSFGQVEVVIAVNLSAGNTSVFKSKFILTSEPGDVIDDEKIAMYSILVAESVVSSHLNLVGEEINIYSSNKSALRRIRGLSNNRDDSAGLLVAQINSGIRYMQERNKVKINLMENR